MIETRKQNYSNKGVQVIRLINKSVNQQASLWLIGLEE